MMNHSSSFRIKDFKILLLFLTFLFVKFSYSSASTQPEAKESQPMVRMAELEIDPAHLSAYKTILAEEAAASVKLEPGVIAIFPMYVEENPTRIKVLEIYASQAAYEQHLKSPHFQKYKTATLDMVKSLKLVNMDAIDTATMPLMFRKLQEEQ